jgi:hypothetical protein
MVSATSVSSSPDLPIFRSAGEDQTEQFVSDRMQRMQPMVDRIDGSATQAARTDPISSQ